MRNGYIVSSGTLNTTTTTATATATATTAGSALPLPWLQATAGGGFKWGKRQLCNFWLLHARKSQIINVVTADVDDK